jgi:hypothetical protein
MKVAAVTKKPENPGTGYLKNRPGLNNPGKKFQKIRDGISVVVLRLSRTPGTAPGSAAGSTSTGRTSRK